MKKILLFTVVCLLGLFGTLKAQETSFFYDFNDGAINGWKNIDADGDGEAWYLANSSGYDGMDGSYGLNSACYHNVELYPDNYIVTESKYAITASSKFSFYHIQSDVFYYNENIGVVVSEDGENYDVIYDYYYNNQLLENWKEEVVDLSAYAGKELYIGLRHYNCNGADANGIKVDNIKLSAGEGGETPEPTAPEAPANLVATATGETTIALTWDAVEDATSYNVYYGTTTVATALTETSYTVEGLTAATEYCYTVKAVKDELESDYSEEACATTNETSIPEGATVLIDEKFDSYTAGDKIAEKGGEWWTTWNKKPGTEEDGVVAELNGNKCGHMTYGVDQVLLLGGEQAGVYDLQFDIMIPENKGGYFNILHNFNASNSTWALESFLNMTNSSTLAAGKGVVTAGGVTSELVCVYDEWMHFRLHVDTDADKAEYYYTLPGEDEVKVCEWQWSLNSQGNATVGRKLDAIDFWPPNASSEFYLDNFSLIKYAGESAPELEFDQESLETVMEKNDVKSVELNLENTGTSIAEFTAWVDYGVGAGGTKNDTINYDLKLSNNSTVLGLVIDEPTVVEVAAMYPASSYSNAVAGTYITHIQYPFLPLTVNNSIGIVEGTPVTFRIYGQGMYNQPGEVLAEKVVPYDELKQSDYTTVQLDEPVALTGFNVWASVTFTHEVGDDQDPHYPFAFDNCGEAAPYGDLFRVGGNTGPFYRASEQFSKDYGNLHIRVICQGESVIAGWAELDKTEAVLSIGATETITVDFNSIGLEEGEYKANIVFLTNVPENEMVEIPVTLNVKGESLEEMLSNVYNIYPNPTSGQVVVEGENINYIAVYNSVGQLINVVKTQSNIVDMSACENGVYFFNVVDNAGQSSIQRVVVAK